MLKDEKFAMRKRIIALLGAGAAVLAFAVAILPAEARPPGGGWSAGSAGWNKVRPHSYRIGRGGALVTSTLGTEGGRYLADDAWFLSDIGGYLAEDQPYPQFWHGSYGSDYGHGYPAYGMRMSYRKLRSHYAVRVHGSGEARRRVVTVHRGIRGGPARRLGR